MCTESDVSFNFGISSHTENGPVSTLGSINFSAPTQKVAFFMGGSYYKVNLSVAKLLSRGIKPTCPQEHQIASFSPLDMSSDHLL